MRLSDISVVIATKDRPEELKKCVESLLGQKEVFPKEIIIVDSSGPGPVTSEKLDPKRPCPVEIIGSRPGLTFQRNLGVKASKGSILAFLDDDCVVNKDYIAELEKAFNELPEAGGVHGLVLNPPKRNRLKRFFTDIFFLPEMSGTGKLKHSGVPSYLDFGVFESKKGPVMVEVLQGCGFSFRKVVFEKGYFFDESLEGYCLGEDYEFSFRVSGEFKLFVVSGPRFYHFETKTARINNRREYYQRIVNVHKFWNRFRKKGPMPVFAISLYFFGVLMQAFGKVLRYGSFNGLSGYIDGMRAITGTVQGK